MTDSSDPEFIQKMRSEHILIDDEGYWSFSFGDDKEFELCVEPIGPEGTYAIALYKNRVLLLNRLPIKKVPDKELSEIPQPQG